MAFDTSGEAVEKLRREGRKFVERFWDWYERHYVLNLTLTTALFTLQLVHLYWLTMHVVFLRLTGESYLTLTPFWQYLIVIIDYTEIPALLSTTVLYTYELRQRFSWRFVWFLCSLNIQWLHLFWITDEFVISQFAGAPTHQPILLPMWLAWIAIVIDYLELPVIADTVVRLVRATSDGRFTRFLKEESKFHIWHL